jgi:pimeloyl-ACP methyl ester carboxylesterase
LLMASNEAVVSACDQRAGRIIDHMTTADVARDLDLLRQAVGDEQLSYMGFSYGSYLGVTYANLFPDRVRALVVDAVLDPVAWATGVNGEGTSVPLPTRLKEYVDAEATLAEFFRLCDAGGPNCAFAPNSAARFNQLADRLKAAPLIIPMPDGTTITFTYDLLIVNTLVSMYTASTWPDLAGLLAALEYFASPAEVGLRLQALREQLGLTTKRGIPNYANYEGQMAVACSDTDNPLDFAVWSAAAHATEQQYPIFGSIWTWIWSTCSTWPGPSASRYTGPFTANTANPVLVVGSTYDPATPYQGAVTVHDLLPNSALLTVDGWGHGSIIMSTCALLTELNYLIYGVTPPEGARCAADVVPFADPPASALARASSAPAYDLSGVFLPDFLKKFVP